MLRTVLWNCFRLRSTSVYPQDLGNNRKLALQIGHVERDEMKPGSLMPGDPLLIKTHEHPTDDKPAIYVLRDGRAACVSLWKFYDKKYPLSTVISGDHRFGTWARHAEAWNPGNRPDTLFIRYEEMVGNLHAVIDAIGGFLCRTPLGFELPLRDDIAGIGGHHVKSFSDWQASLTGRDLELFWKTNGRMMEILYGIKG
jgi:hypothetical protein